MLPTSPMPASDFDASGDHALGLLGVVPDREVELPDGSCQTTTVTKYYECPPWVGQRERDINV